MRASRPATVRHERRVAYARPPRDAREHACGICHGRHPLRADEGRDLDHRKAGGAQPVDKGDLVCRGDGCGFVLEAVPRADFDDGDARPDDARQGSVASASSMSARPGWTSSPSWQWTAETRPSAVARTGSSIFIASSTISVSPRATASPDGRPGSAGRSRASARQAIPHAASARCARARPVAPGRRRNRRRPSAGRRPRTTQVRLPSTRAVTGDVPVDHDGSPWILARACVEDVDGLDGVGGCVAVAFPKHDAARHRVSGPSPSARTTGSRAAVVCGRLQPRRRRECRGCQDRWRWRDAAGERRQMLVDEARVKIAVDEGRERDQAQQERDIRPDAEHRIAGERRPQPRDRRGCAFPPRRSASPAADRS